MGGVITLPKIGLPVEGLPAVALAGRSDRGRVSVEHGVALNPQGDTFPAQDTSTVGFVTLPRGCTRVTWGSPGGIGFLNEYDGDGNWLDYWTPNANPRTVDLKPNARFVKASFKTAGLDSAYIIDTRAGRYIWKGRNVREALSAAIMAAFDAEPDGEADDLPF